MESTLRAALSTSTSLDEEIITYLVNVALDSVHVEHQVHTKKQLVEILFPFLEQFGACSSLDSAEELLRPVEFDERRTQPKRSVVVKPLETPVLKSRPAPSYDDWGTKDMPIQYVRNAVVERIETPAERRRRERKQERDRKQEEMEIEKELRDIETERQKGVANQVTAAERIISEFGKRSNGDVNLENVTLTVGNLGTSRDLLANANLKLARGTRYGLIGRNGYGKSTLLTRIARRELDGFPKDLSILYVAQEVAGSDQSAVECVIRADAELSKLRRMEREAMEANDEEKMARINSQLAALNADSAESRARTILSGLGFSMEMQNAPTTTLSGGWRMRAALASALFAAPDLLLLDEPTNGLSLDAVIWLEDYLCNRLEAHTTLMVVSHDRVFLNEVVNCIMLIEQKELQYFKGNVDTFEKTRLQKRLQQQRERDAQMGKIAHMQKFVDKFRYNAKRASLAQSRLKAISRLEAVLADEVFCEPEMRLEFPDPFDESAGPHLVCEDVSFSYPNSTKPPLFEHVDFNMSPGTKIVLLGLNGLGKSTFLKVLTGKLEPTTGLVRCKSTVRVSFFAQHSVEQLDVKMTPLDFMLFKFPGVTPLDMRPHLAQFGVTSDLCNQRIGTLSGGQKARVAFALVTWTRPHVLLMDEPSSHLDMETADALNLACAVWPGALLIISHDQNLIDTVPDELWVLEKRTIKRMDADFSAYKRRLLKEGCGAA